MPSQSPRPRSATARNRRQRLAAGAVLATTGLMGAYLAALRPQPTYASPLSSDDARMPELGRRSGGPGFGAMSISTCAQADVTVTDDTGLRNAILSSQDDSVICINGTINLGADLPTLDDTTVTFVGDDSTTDVINGGNAHRIFMSDDTATLDDTVTIANLGLRNGYNAGGGAVFVYGGDLIVADSTFTGNTSAGSGLFGLNGGAVFALNGRVAIAGSIFDGNAAGSGYYGGALYLGAVTATVSNTTMSGNYAAVGGAIDAVQGTLTASAVAITDNTSTYGGGAVFLDQNDARFENAFIGGNSSPLYGGGISAQASDVDLVFSTVYGNSTTSGTASQVLVSMYSVLTSYGSAVGNSVDDTALYAVFATIDDSFSVSTGPGSSFTGPGSRKVAAGSLQLGSLDDTQAPGHGGRTPALTSVLVTGAPTSDLGTGLTVDQLGNPRPGSGSTWTIGARQVGFTPNPPNPPAFPPSAPRNVKAEPGDGTAVLSWDPPADPGSFPVTHYRVVSYPGGQSCLVTAPATSCVIEGLTNGHAYNFTVEALNGAGWGPPSAPSEPVTPMAHAVVLVLNQGVRVADGMHDRITTTGSSVHVPAGVRLTPYIKYSGQRAYSKGRATIVVQSDGTFDWTRQVRKNRGLRAFVAWEDTESNRVFWEVVR